MNALGAGFFVAAIVWLSIEVHLWNMEKAIEPPSPDKPWVRRMMRSKIEDTKGPKADETAEIYILLCCFFALAAFVTS